MDDLSNEDKEKILYGLEFLPYALLMASQQLVRDGVSDSEIDRVLELFGHASRDCPGLYDRLSKRWDIQLEWPEPERQIRLSAIREYKQQNR